MQLVCIPKKSSLLCLKFVIGQNPPRSKVIELQEFCIKVRAPLSFVFDSNISVYVVVALDDYVGARNESRAPGFRVIFLDNTELILDGWPLPGRRWPLLG